MIARKQFLTVIPQINRDSQIPLTERLE